MSAAAPDRLPFSRQAQWIWSAEDVYLRAPDRGPFRVRYFRRQFVAPPAATLRVHVSADSVYKLWCNGVLVARGPAKGDVAHQFYDSVDVSARLRPGVNSLAAQVIYYGDAWCRYSKGGAPVSRMTACPGFVLDGVVHAADGAELEALHTDSRWRVLCDRAYTHHADPQRSSLTGLMEDLDAAAFPWGFEEALFDDRRWPAATELCQALRSDDDRDSHQPHRLLPRMTRAPEVSAPRRFRAAFRSPTGHDVAAWSRLLERDEALTVPAGASCIVYLDAGELTTSFPLLRFAGGSGAAVRLRYAEALETSPRQRARRDDLTVGEVRGYADVVRPDGAPRDYEPFDWRTFRFLSLEIETAGDPLTIRGLVHRFCAYPFQRLAKYEASDADQHAIADVCWRTARACAHETYEDCPGFEQLQYGGDTQVQAMISYYVAADASLARQFLGQFDWSRQPNGLTRSRYPSRIPQTIPYWSLHWMLAAHDYWLYTGDQDTVAQLLPGLRATADYFLRRRKNDGTLGRLDGWLVADWSPQWRDGGSGNGAPPGAADGSAAFDSLLALTALEALVALLQGLGQDPTAYRSAAQALRAAAHVAYFDAQRGLYRDRPGADGASAYTNVWAILGRMPCDHARLAQAIRHDSSLCQLTLFSQYFAWRAWAAAGRYDLAVGTLEPWRQMLRWGLTTCPEIPDFSRNRSDCHAWSAGAIVEFHREVLGVQPAAPGYRAILIRPSPLDLSWARGNVPLTRPDPSAPVRFVNVEWRIEQGLFHLDVSSPPGIPTTIVLPDEQQHRSDGGAVHLACPAPTPPRAPAGISSPDRFP